MVIYTAYFKSFVIRKAKGSFDLINQITISTAIDNSMQRTFKLKPFLGPKD